MENTEKVCPLCKKKIEDGECEKVCPVCGTAHHKSCWEENNGCTNADCAENKNNKTEMSQKDLPQNETDSTEEVPEINQNSGEDKNLPEEEKVIECEDKTEGNPSVDLEDEQNTQELWSEVSDKADQNEKSKRNTKTALIVGVIAVVVIIFGYVGMLNYQKNLLKEQLMANTWVTFEDDTRLSLDFDDNQIDYYGYFLIGNIKIADLEYEVLNKDTIRIMGAMNVNVDIDGDIVTFTPSFINNEPYSIWIKD